MAENRILGYKRIFGFVLPEWVNENMIRMIVAGLLSSVLMFLVLIFVIWPNFETVEARTAELEEKKRGLESLRTSGQGLDRIKNDIPEEAQDRILAAMPTQYSPEAAIYLLRRISADTGVSIISYSLPSGVISDNAPIPAQGNGGGEMVSFAAYPVRITVAAPVDALLAFIARIESSLPFGVVSDLSLQEVTKLSRSIGDKAVQLAMEIRFYQAILRSVNINKLQVLTAEEVTLANQLIDYNLLTVPESGEGTLPVSATGAGSIFGF